MTRGGRACETGSVFGSTKRTLTTADDALPGRTTPLPDILERHEVLGTSMLGPWPAGTEVLYIAMGCFWGAERIFWRLPGVVTTAAGYLGGFTPNPPTKRSAAVARATPKRCSSRMTRP